MSLIDDTAAPLEDEPTGGSGLAAAGPSSWYVLRDYPLEIQEETLWCWSASSVGVARFFNPSAVWNQCSLVNAVLGRQDCCLTHRPADCNDEWNLRDPLQKVGHFGARSGGPWTMSQIRVMIDDDRPIGARLEWASTGRGHFVFITGYSDADEVQVHDSDLDEGGILRYDYDAFRQKYRTDGSWTHAYTVQR